MQKTQVICSFLMAFGLSTLMVGCEPGTETKKVEKATTNAKAASDKSEASKTGVKSETKSAPPVKKTPSVGSQLPGGADVPTRPSAGSDEKPK